MSVITRVDAYLIRAPLRQPFGSSIGWARERTSVLVRITTHDGVQGWGEAGIGATPALVPTIIDVIAPTIIGRDAFDRQGLFDAVVQRHKPAGQRGLLIQAMSGIDIAVWDAVGKALDQPVYRLLGGTPELSLSVYATGLGYIEGLDTRELLAARRSEAERFKELGFRGVKMKIGLLPERDDLAQVEGIRAVLGDDIELMVDANQAYHGPTARRIASSLASMGIRWFEEPVPNQDLDGLRELRSYGVAIAGGEMDSTRAAFQEILEQRALDIIQPDICMAGGYTELQRIGDLAAASNVGCCPHHWGSGVAIAATLQFAAVCPSRPKIFGGSVSEFAMEYDQTENPLRHLTDLAPGAFGDGKVNVPDLPGIGLDVEPESFEPYCVAHAHRSAES